jgi:predicted dithiol-disulfide oxidoreductase (DUF899 family)
MPKTLHSTRFPGETDAYRTARDELLRSEIELRRQTETVAAMRRALPLGGPVDEDYVFDKPDAKNDLGSETQVRLSELFRPGMDSLAIYSFMFGPKMPEACFACTSILDGLDGAAPHILQRINFAVVAKSPLRRIREFARERGWRNLPFLSSFSNEYNRDYHGENAKGDQLPSLNAFVKRDGRIHHFYNTELLFVPSEPGQDGRHVDTIWPIWNMLDFTAAGRGTNWHPKLKYD